MRVQHVTRAAGEEEVCIASYAQFTEHVVFWMPKGKLISNELCANDTRTVVATCNKYFVERTYVPGLILTVIGCHKQKGTAEKIIER